MPLSKQARHCKRLAESKKLAKNAESQETAPTKKYEKKLFKRFQQRLLKKKQGQEQKSRALEVTL